MQVRPNLPFLWKEERGKSCEIRGEHWMSSFVKTKTCSNTSVIAVLKDLCSIGLWTLSRRVSGLYASQGLGYCGKWRCNGTLYFVF